MHRLRRGSHEFLLLAPGESAPGEPVVFDDPTACLPFVASLAQDPLNHAAIRAALVPVVPVHSPESADGRELARLLAHEILHRRYRIVRPPPPRAFGGPSSPTSSSASSAAASPGAKIWIRFRVIDDYTREAVKDVQLKITPPSADESEHATDGGGFVELKEVDPGSGSVASKIPDAKLEQTLEYVGWGEDVPAPEGGPKDKYPAGPFQIRTVERHRVRTGETLDSLAQAAGMTWQQLAKFNWGTDQPKKINQHLRFELGCTKKDASGANYRFDDADRPGILLIPQDWSSSGHSTERTHVVRVRRIRRSVPVWIDDPFLGPLGKLDVTVKYADGSEESLKTDDRGAIEVRLERWSEQGNYADLKFKTELREHKRRVFLVVEHADTKIGAWQRLVNLGFVDLAEPKCEPENDDVFAATLEAFQAENGILPDGELDPETSSALEDRHEAATTWGDFARTEIAVAEDRENCSAPKEAIA